jgi:hypothetical protein
VTLFFALHESAIGPKQTLTLTLHMSAFGGKADIVWTSRNVLITQSELAH